MFKSKIVRFELMAFIVLMILGVMWMLNPEGNIEPFFAFSSLSFIGAELCRRGLFDFVKSMKKVNANIAPIQSTSDEEFMLLDKIEKLTLSNNIYHPETGEMNVCISLANKGYFYKDGELFVLTDECLEYLGKKNA